MPIEKLVVPLPAGLKVHVERHVFNPAFESVILINGALATTASFGQTIKYLGERYNAICFDLPYAGQSKAHNKSGFILTKDDEVDILLYLIGLFEPAFLLSVSWGGVASLLALSRASTSVRRAVIASFSPRLNGAMTAYVSSARDHIGAGENLKAAQLLNDTVGKHLPRIMKLYNYRYLATLPRDEQEQVAFHVEQILAIRPEDYLHEFRNIGCGLKFLNGEIDEYTTPSDVRSLAAHLRDAQFATIPQAGHFLDLEGKAALRQVRAEILDYFGPAPAQAGNRALDCFDALAARSALLPAQATAAAHATSHVTPHVPDAALHAAADHSFQQVELP